MAYYETDMPPIINTGGNNGNNGGMWGGDGGWWAIILFAMIFGWGNNGWGGFGNGGGANGALTRGDLCQDMNFNDLQSSVRGVQQGICDSTFALNNTITNGFAGVQQTLCQGFGGINTAIMQNGYETRGAITDLGYRLQDCCCQTQRAIDGVNYNMAKNTCDIIQSGNNNTQRIIDFLTGEKISSLQAQNSLLQAQLSQNSQTATINASINNAVNELRPIAKPAYITCSPYQSAYGFPYSGNYGNCGCNNQCGCASIQ
ncbi:MAG: hypothetical protein [Podoviridae sp. ctcf755]|nr:MAG: hypothetical protein [Podoviridae sp. ctcf755]